MSPSQCGSNFKLRGSLSGSGAAGRTQMTTALAAILQALPRVRRMSNEKACDLKGAFLETPCSDGAVYMYIGLRQ